MQGKPIYTSITQQEENEVAEEVREAYKSISSDVNKPIMCCPNSQSNYLYLPKSLTTKAPERREVLAGNSNDENKASSKHDDDESDFENDSLFSFHQNENEMNEESMNNENSRDDNHHNKSRSLFLDLESGEQTNSRDKNSGCERSSSQQSKTTSHTTSARGGDEYIVNLSSKTNFEMDYREVESILTSVSRMDKRRIQKLKDTDFYRNLPYDREECLNLSLDSIDNMQSTVDSAETPVVLDNINDISISHYEDDLSSIATDNKDEYENTSDDSDDYESELAEWESISKRSLRKPLRYIDRDDSESFFKIVRPALNPDEFSESGRTSSEDFKRSRRASEEISGILESSFSATTYGSHDRVDGVKLVNEILQTESNAFTDHLTTNSSSLLGGRSNDRENRENVYDYHAGKRNNDNNSKSPYTTFHQLTATSQYTTSPLSCMNTSKDTLNAADYEEIAANLSYDDETLSLTLPELEEVTHQKRNNNSEMKKSQFDFDFESVKKILRNHSSTDVHRSSFGGDAAKGFATSTRNFDENENTRTFSCESPTRTRTTSKTDDNFCQTSAENTDRLFRMSSSTPVSAGKAHPPPQPQQQGSGGYLRTPSKFKSVRGNLSTYISSRQCATKSACGHSKQHNRSMSPRLSPPRKVGQSPGRRMFQSGRNVIQNH